MTSARFVRFLGVTASITIALLLGACTSPTAATTLAIPAHLTVSGTSATSISISWDAVSGATSYQLYRDTSVSGSFSTQVYSGSATSYTDTSLSAGTTYFYKVKASNSSGSSALSAAVAIGTSSGGSTTSGLGPVPSLLETDTGNQGVAFDSVATDGSGNVYVSGGVMSAGTYGFGNSVTATVGGSGDNGIIVKYNSAGQAQWAQTPTSGTGFYVNAIAVDSSGNVYAAGYVDPGTFDFGNGVTATGTSAGLNVILVKYDTNGTAQWADSLTEGDGSAEFYGVAVDSSGNVYAAGSDDDGTTPTTYGFGNNVTATGSAAYSYENVLLVKYDSSGNAQWAQTLTSGSNAWFTGVAVDSSGSVYAVGQSYGTAQFGFGNSVTATGFFTQSFNPILVKYDSSGAAQWAQTDSSTTAPDAAQAAYSSVAVDSSGYVYVAGGVSGPATVGFGSGVSLSCTGTNVLVMKYDQTGKALWAQTNGGASAWYNGIAVDSSGNVYAAGSICAFGTSSDLGNAVVVPSCYDPANEVLLVKYSSSGLAQWYETLVTDYTSNIIGNADFAGVAVDTSGDIYAAGSVSPTGTFNFGNGFSIDVTESVGAEPVILRY